MFENFKHDRIDTGETVIDVRHGGSGPPLLLLHGFPQTKAMWAHCAADLAADFTVYAADLRGYGDSGKPPTTPDHEPYSKRAMARDMVALMRHFGHERFNLAGHDSHGVGMMPAYIQNTTTGRCIRNHHAKIIKDNGAVIVIDGGVGYG